MPVFVPGGGYGADNRKYDGLVSHYIRSAKRKRKLDTPLDKSFTGTIAAIQRKILL